VSGGEHRNRTHERSAVAEGRRVEPRDRRAQRIHRRARRAPPACADLGSVSHPRGCEGRLLGRLFGRARQTPVVDQKPRRLEGNLPTQLLDRSARDEQLARLAVHVGERRSAHDHALKPSYTVGTSGSMFIVSSTSATLGSVPALINVDSTMHEDAFISARDAAELPG
jgi:hypothetical protein